MCMMTPQGIVNTPREALKPLREPGPASPDDKVNDQKIPNANDRSAQEAERNEQDAQKKAQSEKYG